MSELPYWVPKNIEMVLESGTIVHFHGMPFELTQRTLVWGSPSNMAQAIAAQQAQNAQSNTQAVMDSVNGVSGD